MRGMAEAKINLGWCVAHRSRVQTRGAGRVTAKVGRAAPCAPARQVDTNHALIEQ